MYFFLKLSPIHLFGTLDNVGELVLPEEVEAEPLICHDNAAKTRRSVMKKYMLLFFLIWRIV